MYDRDAVIRHAAEAANKHATQVQAALADYLRLGAPAVGALRDALVAQSVGFEGAAHDGQTHIARVEAAKAALVAWDGPADQMSTIRLGSRRVRCHTDLAQRAGWGYIVTMPDGSREAQPNTGFQEASVAELAQALGEGLDGDDAMLRTIVLRAQKCETQVARQHSEKVAHEESKAAGMALAAARERSKKS
jgi:hypothetical protein